MRPTIPSALVGLVAACAFPAAAAPTALTVHPGPDAAGDPSAWRAEHAKALDPVYDTAIPGAAHGDLMSLYYDQNVDRLAFRVGLKDLGHDDYVTDGRVELDVNLDWGSGAASVRIGAGIGGGTRSAVGAFITETGRASATAGVRRVTVTPEHQMVEISLDLPFGFKEAGVRAAAGRNLLDWPRIAPGAAARDATPLAISVTTLVDGRVQDEIRTDNTARAGAKNVAFVHHGNQGLTYTDVFRGNRGENAAGPTDLNNPDDGFDELLDAHQAWSLPGCFHVAGQLQTAAEWHDPAWNTWLANGVTAGWADMITSAYAQHIMPFAQDAMNNWAVNIEKAMTDWRYGGNATVAWIPERVWLESSDNDGNGIDASCGVVDATLWDNWLQHGVNAVILDDVWHLVQYDGPFDDRHIYVGGNGLKFVPIDNTFVGDVNWNWGNAWNSIQGLSSDELMVYGNDWEFPAEISQGASNPNALNNYLEVLNQCALNAGTVSTWRLTDAINEPSFLQNMDGRPVENATYGLLGAHGGYGGGCNFWYTDWAGYSDPLHVWDFHTPMWDYGTIWNNAVTKLYGVASNDLSESGWYVLMTNLHETGWHDNGEISGWIHRYSNKIKNANVYTEASRWADGQYAITTNAYLADIDEDGQDEAVIHNDHVMAVFETIGGRATHVFAKGPGYGYSVVGNCNVFWVDTEGDYNETNHVAAFSDVSVAGLNRENDLYALNVTQTAPGTTVQLELVHPNVTKTVSLTEGDKYLDVIWDAAGQDVYVKSGFTPDLVDLIWNAEMDRLWAPSPGGTYFGQRNPNTGATVAMIVGQGGATHNSQFTSTLMEVDEFSGRGKFQTYLYAGETAVPDGSGAIAELDSIAALLVDVLPPVPTGALYFPSADKLTLTFDEEVVYDQIFLNGVSVDDDDDGSPELTLGGTSTVLTTQNSSRIDIQLDAADAVTLEGLNTAALELQLVLGTVQDAAGNFNPAVTHLDDLVIDYQPVTTVTIDGFIDSAEWTAETCLVDDYWDSAWTTTAPGDTNDINALYATWDSTYLYVGIRGIVYNNSWLLYLDTDPGGPNGSDDLTALDAWERGATFTGGFRADFQYAAFQHQNAFDGDSFYRILSDTTTADLSGSVIKAMDSSHIYYADGGSEIAVPWDVLYGLGPGNVPPGASLCFVASVCYDPEPNGELGGDSAPDNGTALLPDVDRWLTITIDGDGDGLPDDPSAVVDAPAVGAAAVPVRLAITAVSPNPFAASTRVSFAVPGPAAAETRLSVVDVAGRRLVRLVDGVLEPGAHEVVWDGRDAAGTRLASGVYFLHLESAESAAVTQKVLRLR